MKARYEKQIRNIWKEKKNLSQLNVHCWTVSMKPEHAVGRQTGQSWGKLKWNYSIEPYQNDFLKLIFKFSLLEIFRGN